MQNTHQARHPGSNAPDTFDGPTATDDGHPYQFGLRGGIAKDHEDPSKLYVIRDGDGEAMRSILYDGKSFANAEEIEAYRQGLIAQGYSLAHLDGHKSKPGNASARQDADTSNDGAASDGADESYASTHE